MKFALLASWLCVLVVMTVTAQACRVPVFVMLPLDVVTDDGKMKDANKFVQDIRKLKQGGAEGFMVDVWWGLVEQQEKVYNWEAYRQMFQYAANEGLKVQAVMSFHQCGGNVGDNCNIPLPDFVTKVEDSIFYTDREGSVNKEYISLSADTRPVFNGRTAVDLYTDFMSSFASNFTDMLGKTIVEIQVGLGPAGELRYPSYPLSKWNFPGIGEFQCHDKYLLKDFSASAANAGHPEWNMPPGDAGSYSTSDPEQTNFFRSDGGYDSAYGRFFLNWYSSKLLNHGDMVLASASKIFGSTGVGLAAKISGIHWHYRTSSHAAECTAGYYNTNGNNAYASFAKMFAKHQVGVDFTCLEMTNDSQPAQANSAPEQLVAQVRDAAWAAGTSFKGENALPRYDDAAYQQIARQCRPGSDKCAQDFTYLRLTDDLIYNGDNWGRFTNFINRMKNL